MRKIVYQPLRGVLDSGAGDFTISALNIYPQDIQR